MNILLVNEPNDAMTVVFIKAKIEVHFASVELVGMRSSLEDAADMCCLGIKTIRGPVSFTSSSDSVSFETSVVSFEGTSSCTSLSSEVIVSSGADSTSIFKVNSSVSLGCIFCRLVLEEGLSVR